MRPSFPTAALAAVALAAAACGTARQLSPEEVLPTPTPGSPGSSPSVCTACHGDAAAANCAPPRAVSGETDTTARGVGAHQAHLNPGPFAGPVACSECHVVPTTVDAPGHGRASQAPVVFGALALSGGAQPTWNTTGLSCASTYCHGATLGGGSLTAPAWTRVDGTQAGCGTCHGVPPPSPHPAASGLAACAACHPDTVRPDGTIDVAGGKHVNGTVEAAGGGGGCTACHGDASRTPSAIAAAPPRDTRGQTSSSAVGAHLAHLTGGAVRAALACTDCHVVPGDAAHATRPLDLTWGALARSGGVAPSWTAATLTCTNYCHGASLSGGGDTTPTWDGGPAAAACGTCHGLPPTSGHPSVAGSGTARCRACHPATVAADGSIDVAGGKHVNGAVDASGGSGCSSCHGSASGFAPPTDTTGASTGTRVGAHQAHVSGKTFSDGLGGSSSCPECHGATPTSAGHSDGRVQIGWASATRAAINGDTANPTTLTPGATATCTNSCHVVKDWKGTSSGGTKLTWSWTDTNSSCSACHGSLLGPLPPTGRHAKHASVPCSGCHGAGYAAWGTVARGTHVDGRVQVIVPGWSRTANGNTGSCSGVLCHEDGGSESWWGGGWDD